MTPQSSPCNTASGRGLPYATAVSLLAALLTAPLTTSAAAAAPVDPPRDWATTIGARLAAEEYHFRPTATGWTAPNRGQDLRTTTADGAIAIEPRRDRSSWRFTYRFGHAYRTGAMGASFGSVVGNVAGDVVVSEDNEPTTLRIHRDGLTEWYVNRPDGIEQGFTIEARPEGTGLLMLDGEIDGLLATVSDDGAVVALRTAAGVAVLQVAALHVFDADQRPLPACFEVGPGRLGIVIDDRDATYPLLVDPLFTTPSWTANGDQTGAWFGHAVASAGDVNGDGYGDILVGAFQYDGGEADEGRAFLFLGSPAGPALVANWTAESDQPGAYFGRALAAAGDVDGDGFGDVVIGAEQFDGGQVDQGRVYVYHGSATGLSPTPTWTADGDQAAATFGFAVASAGDVDGDGYDDVIVGADQYDATQPDEGRALLFHGSAAGLEPSPRWTFDSGQPNALLGRAVAGAGDVDGDGYGDVLVGAYFFDDGEQDEGRVYLFHGAASGLEPVPRWTANGDQPFAAFGFSLAAAGDVDGDGYADVIIGAHAFDGGEIEEGRALVYLGSSTGLGGMPAWTFEPDQADAYLGSAVAGAGDVNGDGFADVIVGAERFDGGEANEGRALAFFGSPVGLGSVPAWTAESDQADAYFGVAVACAGDVDGDGYSDILVGAERYDDGELDEGRAYLFRGSPAGLAATPGWTADGDQASAAFGFAVAGAGDVNGDGYSDVVVGAYQYDSGEIDEGRADVYHGAAGGLETLPSWTAYGGQAGAWFGVAVAGAGDVNGDGYSDVVIGASKHDDGELDEGRAYVYHGSAAGLGVTPRWIAASDQARAQFGVAVAGAGDVDGDGYGDVLVGADLFTNGEFFEGRAYLYRGGRSGLEATPAWTAEGDQNGAGLGISVASAGDVDRDGYSDVVIGAHAFDGGEADEGRAYLYRGSATGLEPDASWTAEGDQAGASFGYAVAGAGDIDGDGFSDVVIGAYHQDNGQTDEGMAYLYRGSATGLEATPAWIAEGDQPGAAFGVAVASAGDVDGDGYSDVAIGAFLYSNGEMGEGSAYVYRGSGSGLGTTPAWSAEGGQVFALFGIAVAGAGDVDGDGYDDVVCGAFQYDGGASDGGRVQLFYGNAGGGLDRIPRQARASGTAPVDLLGAVPASDGFRLRANLRSPFGRDQVRLEWEVKPLAMPFDGTGLQLSPWFDTGAPGSDGSVVAIDQLHPPLPALGPYHWRLRLRRHGSCPWQSHWMSPAGNATTETDLRARADDPPCDLQFADLTFPPVTPSRTGPWVYTESCAGGDVLPTLLVPTVSPGPIDTAGGPGGSLRLYQLSCDCAAGLYLVRQAGDIRFEPF